jgi:hypothetical protein
MLFHVVCVLVPVVQGQYGWVKATENGSRTFASMRALVVATRNVAEVVMSV